MLQYLHQHSRKRDIHDNQRTPRRKETISGKASSLGVSSSLIAAIEQGSKKVSANLAAKVKEVYGVALGESDKMASDAAAAKAAEEPVPEEKAEKKVKTT